MKKYRSELKYICMERDLELIKNKISNVLCVDPNSNENGRYCIHSLYFDDYKNTCMKEIDSGDFKRSKWRIRYYNNFENSLYLEKKEKLFGKCHKKKCKLSVDEYYSIIKGNYMDVFWNTEQKLLKQFIIDIITRDFKPKVIIDYERFAFIEPILNIRITLDTNISASYDIYNFLNSNYIKYPIQNKNYHVVEVKFDDILPSYIKNIFYSYNFKQTSFSKYYLGRKKIDGVLL